MLLVVKTQKKYRLVDAEQIKGKIQISSCDCGVSVNTASNMHVVRKKREVEVCSAVSLVQFVIGILVSVCIGKWGLCNAVLELDDYVLFSNKKTGR